MTRFLFFASLVLLPSISLAEQTSGVGAPYWSGVETMDSNGATCVSTSTSSGDTCMLFPAGVGREHRSIVSVFASNQPGWCCWSHTYPDVTISGSSVTYRGTASGPGACFRVGDISGAEVHQSPVALALSNKGAPGAHTGICSASISNLGRDALYETCTADADCVQASAATCTAAANTTKAQRDGVGLYLICDADSTSMSLKARKEYVPQY